MDETKPIFIRLFGTFSVTIPGTSDAAVTHFRTRATRELIAFLSFRCGVLYPRARLIEQFWQNQSDESGRNSLSLALSSLRDIFGRKESEFAGALYTDRLVIGLSEQRIMTDVHLFEGYAESARRSKYEGERLLLSQKAVALYTDDLLPDFEGEWVLSERERLLQICRSLLHCLQQQYHERGDQAALLQIQNHPALAPTEERETVEGMPHLLPGEIIRFAAQQRNREAAVRSLELLAVGHAMLNLYALATHYAGAAAVLRIQGGMPPSVCPEWARQERRCRAELGEAGFALQRMAGVRAAQDALTIRARHQ